MPPAPEVPPEVVTLPDEPPAAPPADADAPRPPKRPKAKQRARFFDNDGEREQTHERDDRSEEATSAEPSSEQTESKPDGPAPPWRLAGSHFVLSAERLTSILAWNRKSTTEVDGSGSSGAKKTVETTISGTNVHLLGASGSANPFAAPRIGFDYVSEGGFTLGGTLGYMVTSSKVESSESDSSNTSSADSPTVDLFLFAPRVGVFIEVAPNVALWLRGGVTRAVASSELEGVPDGDGGTMTLSTTQSFWDLTLDPQLVVSPAPYFGLTVGLSLDIGVSGKQEQELGTTTIEDDVTASSYGVTAGVVGLF
jgi:hypothetical protein